jgi:hypothetical protein
MEAREFVANEFVHHIRSKIKDHRSYGGDISETVTTTLSLTGNEYVDSGLNKGRQLLDRNLVYIRKSHNSGKKINKSLSF